MSISTLLYQVQVLFFGPRSIAVGQNLAAYGTSSDESKKHPRVWMQLLRLDATTT